VEQRTLGRSGIAVSRLGIGLAAIARPGYITLGRDRDLAGTRSADALHARCAEVLDAARAAGVRYVDVARSYGRAEEFLARWLAERGVPADAVSVGS
jgi:aryl-alcohol dehydrogenase-like predicted oxidoreductase